MSREDEPIVIVYDSISKARTALARIVDGGVVAPGALRITAGAHANFGAEAAGRGVDVDELPEVTIVLDLSLTTILDGLGVGIDQRVLLQGFDTCVSVDKAG